MRDLWTNDAVEAWREALASYEAVVERQGVARLMDLDRWVRAELPATIATRASPHVTHAELVKVAEWKMARGVWRGRNLALVRGNEPAAVIAISTAALAEVPHPSAPIATLAQLAGVGPATASAVAAAAAPNLYPFFDELVAAQVPGLGKVAFTLGTTRITRRRCAHAPSDSARRGRPFSSSGLSGPMSAARLASGR